MITYKKLVLLLTILPVYSVTLDDARNWPVIGVLINKIKPKPAEPKIVRFARATIVGEIQSSGQAIQQIFTLSQNGTIDGIMFVIDSGGGSPTHAELIAEAITRAAQAKPAISFVSVAASGGYLLAASTPYIMATSSAALGSIGAFWYTERSKDKNIIQLSPEYYKFPRFEPDGSTLVPDHEAFYTEYAAEASAWFRDMLVRMRPVLTLQDLLDMQGKIFHAQDALEYKLIDAIGSLKDAVVELYKRAGSPACQSIELLHDDGHVMARYTPEELSLSPEEFL